MSRKAFIFGLVVVGLLIVSLYRAKYGAREAREELKVVEAQIDMALDEKALLETELSYASRREWVEEYARTELGMGPAKPEQLARPSDLDVLIGPAVETGEPRTRRQTDSGEGG